MENKKRVFLIDSENVSSEAYNGLELLNRNDEIIIFVSKHSCAVNPALMFDVIKGGFKCNAIEVTRDNTFEDRDTMDNYIISYISKEWHEDRYSLKKKLLNKLKGVEKEYYVISKDKGFDNWRKILYANESLVFYRGVSISKAVNSLKSPLQFKRDNADKNLNSQSKTKTKAKSKNKTKSKNNVKSKSRDKVVSISGNADSKTSLVASPVTAVTLSENVQGLDKVKKISSIKMMKLRGNVYSSSVYEPVLSENVNCVDVDVNVNAWSVDINAIKSRIDNPLKFNFAYSPNYQSYFNSRKILRDDVFVNEKIVEYGLDKKYSAKKIKVFLKFCKEGVSVKKINNVVRAVFKEEAIKDFKPVINDILKFQSEYDIM